MLPFFGTRSGPGSNGVNQRVAGYALRVPGFDYVSIRLQTRNSQLGTRNSLHSSTPILPGPDLASKARGIEHTLWKYHNNSIMSLGISRQGRPLLHRNVDRKEAL